MSRTDRMLADIERGFAALEAGKIDAAATIVDRLRRIDRKNPDVVTLAAATADAQGDVEEAIAQYRLLVELQPDNPMPRICVARLELHDVGDADAALDTVEAAFDFIDDEADLVEAICVKTEALLARDEPVAARETLAELATSVIDDADLALDLGELALAAEDPAAALRFIEIARKADPEIEADALHAIGRVHEVTGERDKMIEAWKQVRTLDLAAPPGKVHVTEDEVERIAAATLEELPANIRERLANVPIMIDTVPSEDIVADGYDPRMLGFFQGVPMPEDGGAQPTVTNILLFKTNLERSATDEEHLAEEIRITVLHETAHYFGLDEDDLVAIGLD